MTDIEQAATELLEQAFGQSGSNSPQAASDVDFEVTSFSDANQGRGVFSLVIRAELAWARPTTGQPPDGDGGGGGGGPTSVVVKLPAVGANGDAAAASGAYRRESLAYRTILPSSPVRSPTPYLVADEGERSSFVMQDLQDHRMVDQLDGLDATDALAVADELARFHRHWRRHPNLTVLEIRRSTPTALDQEALQAGLGMLNDRWRDDLEDEHVDAFNQLVANRQHLADAFARQGPHTLCHGDPRADNLAFDSSDRAVLFDWQQLAVQFGEADLSWLAATSLQPALRRTVDRDLISAYGTSLDAYRLGFVLPGLAVLLLCQRQLTGERSRRFVATSLVRIGTALVDLDIANLRV